MQQILKEPDCTPKKQTWEPPKLEKLGNLHELVLKGGKSGSSQDGKSANFMN